MVLSCYDDQILSTVIRLLPTYPKKLKIECHQFISFCKPSFNKIITAMIVVNFLSYEFCHLQFSIHILSSALHVNYLHLIIHISSSAFFHQHFVICILSSAFCHPHYVICIFSSAIFHLPSSICCHLVHTLQRPHQAGDLHFKLATSFKILVAMMATKMAANWRVL